MSLFLRRLFRYRCYDLFEAAPIFSSPALHAVYRFRPVTAKDAELLGMLTPTSSREARRRFAFGDACFGVWRDSLPATVFWIHRGSCYVRGADFYLEADLNTVYLYDVYTVPAHRRKGLYEAGLRHLTNCFAGCGVTQIKQLVKPDNRPVLATLQKLGYRKVRRLRHVRILGFRLPRWRPSSAATCPNRRVAREHCYQI